MGTKRPVQFLDCTLGLANDAIFVSTILGEESHVVGLESSPIIYAITKYGLNNCKKGSLVMQKAMANIEVIKQNYQSYLANCQANSYDFVYFDPMFDFALTKSSGIHGLRAYANYEPLTMSNIEQAKIVAKDKVIVKHRKGSLKHLAFDELCGGKYSAVDYGVFYP